MGKECKQILNRLGLTTAELKQTDTILTKLEAHFAPARNILFERYRFHSAEQQPTETVDQFLIRLKHLAESCAFSDLQDEMIRDRLALGCQDHETRARLFREKECTLVKAVELLRVSEVTRQQLKHINEEVTDRQSVNAVVPSRTRILGSFLIHRPDHTDQTRPPVLKHRPTLPDQTARRPAANYRPDHARRLCGDYRPDDCGSN